MSYRQTPEEIVARLETSRSGLSGEEVARRLSRDGYNQLESASRVSPLIIFLNQFKSFIIYILLFAVFFSILIGEWVDSLIILAILVANALIGFFQELSANRSLEALKKMAPQHAMVRRQGIWQRIDAKELVVGDIIRVEAGDKVPADGRLLEAVRLKTDEAPLTGESVPVDKHAEVIEAEVPLGERLNLLFASTAVVTGNGLAVVTATGMHTEIGAITKLIEEAEEEMTPLQQRLDRFGRQLGYVIIGVCLFIFGVTFAKEWFNGGITLATSVDFAFVAISLAVAAVPTALPAVVTIALSIGVKRLLAKKALVRKLGSVETLGSCDIICTDKTGTLTENRMTVLRAWTLDGEATLSGVGYEPAGEVSARLNPLLYQAGLYCNNATLAEKDNEWRITGDPTEAALLVSGAKAGITAAGARLDELPFDSERKLMSVLIEEEGQLGMYSKGAPAELLACCSLVRLDGGIDAPLTEQLKDKILHQNDLYAGKALRVLGLAFRPLAAREEFAERDLVFVGLQAMRDPPRPDVSAAIERTREANIRVIMITGDYRETARAIGEEIGIRGRMCSGTELDILTEDQLVERLRDNTNIFSRVIPFHKQRIVAALQRLGHTVAMTGDGVNDAPALKKANIGVAVGSGTEVAKEAADFVLLDDSFTNIVNAVEEGRGIYDNIQKSIMLLLSGNLGEVLIIFLAVIFGLNLPLTAILLLWINMVTDGAPALAFSVDPYGRDIMYRPPKPRDEGILPLAKLMVIVVLGVVGTAIALAIFAVYGGRSSEPVEIMHGQTMVFNFVVIYEAILVFVIRQGYRVPFFSNFWVWGSVALSFLLQGLIIYTPLAPVFKVVPLSFQEVMVLIFGGLLVWASSALYYNLLRFYRRKKSASV